MMELQEKKQAPLTVGEVADAIGIPKSTLHRYLKDLLQDGLIMRLGRGKYAVSGMYLQMCLSEIWRDYDKHHWVTVFKSA
jgi:DNA-binding IclR family transcriptional regulator